MNAILPQLSFGFLAGYAAGLALRFVGRLAALFLGLFFIGIQTLAYLGYIQVDWYRIQADLEPALKPEMLSSLWDRLLAVLTYNAPFGGGLAAGLLFGLRGR